MPRGIAPATLIELAKDKLRPAWFIAVEFTTGWRYYWSGVGPKDWNGVTWTAAAAQGVLSGIVGSEEARADNISVGLANVDPAVVADVLANVSPRLSALIYLGCLDDAEALIVDPSLIFSGLTSVPVIKDDAVSVDVSIDLDSRYVLLNRKRVRRYSHADQLAAFPDDPGFEYVVVMSTGNDPEVNAAWVDPYLTDAGVPRR